MQKVWWFDTWKDIHPEYHTEENKYWHSHQAKANSSEIASNNKRKFSKETVIQMRKDYDSGLCFLKQTDPDNLMSPGSVL